MRIAIVYHSETGNTQKMAELIREGCGSVDGVEAKTMAVDNVDEAFLAEARAAFLAQLAKTTLHDLARTRKLIRKRKSRKRS